MDQKNSVYGHFLRSGDFLRISSELDIDISRLLHKITEDVKV